MELAEDKVFKIPIYSISDFAKKFANGVQTQSVHYAMDNGIIDFIKIGTRKYVVMTAKTKEYKPNSSPRRQTA